MVLYGLSTVSSARGNHFCCFHIYFLIMYYISWNTRVLCSANTHLFSPKFRCLIFLLSLNMYRWMDRVACLDERLCNYVKWQRNMYFKCALSHSKQQPAIPYLQPCRKNQNEQRMKNETKRNKKVFPFLSLELSISNLVA